jgi:hypothetical protein
MRVTAPQAIGTGRFTLLKKPHAKLMNDATNTLLIEKPKTPMEWAQIDSQIKFGLGYDKDSGPLYQPTLMVLEVLAKQFSL